MSVRKRIMENSQTIYKYCWHSVQQRDKDLEVLDKLEGNMDTSETELVSDSPRSTEAPGVHSDSDLMEHVEKRRRTNGDKASNINTNSDTNDLQVTIINKLDETNIKVDDMNSNLTSRLDMALNEISENRKDIVMLKDT